MISTKVIFLNTKLACGWLKAKRKVGETEYIVDAIIAQSSYKIASKYLEFKFIDNKVEYAQDRLKLRRVGVSLQMQS